MISGCFGRTERYSRWGRLSRQMAENFAVCSGLVKSPFQVIILIDSFDEES